LSSLIKKPTGRRRLPVTEKEEWNSKEVADHHLRTADILIPGRREMLSIVARLVTAFVSGQPRILDIGCGWGDVTEEILGVRPLAMVCMVDFSDEMLRQAKERFGNNKKVQIIKHDLNKGVPDSLQSSKFGAVVSCNALHHVEYENKVGLYTQIRQVMDEGGLFINGDRFIGESPVISGWEFDNWITWMIGQIKNGLGIDRTFEQVKARQMYFDRKLGDKPGTLWETERDLRQAGFQYVDCVWKSHNMGIVIAANR
jgi:tRNA (cmo5U34)-methyltransferase